MTGEWRRSIPRRTIAIGAIALAAIAVVFVARRGGERRAPVAAHSQRPAAADPFTTIAPDTVPIAWQAWSAETFARARAGSRPLAVLVDAAWSESCRLYAAAIAAHAPLRAAMDSTVPVRVDADRRPDIFERYCASTLPAWVFLSPDGRVVQVMEAMPPAALARRLATLIAEPAPAHDPGIEALRALVPVPPPAGDLAAAAAGVVAALHAEWPAIGAALEPAAPLLDGDALELLALRARLGDSASATLYADALARVAALAARDGAIDQESFPAPGRVQRGRFLLTHATWLVHWQRAAAAGAPGRAAPPGAIDAAAHVRAWLDSTLWDEARGLYRAAQGTLVLHDGRPALTSSESARMRASGHAMIPAPHVVDVYPMAGNARAAVALLETPRGTPDAAARRERGARILAVLVQAWRHEGFVPHDLAPDAGGTLRAGDCEWMGDAAELGRALLAAAAVTGSSAERARLQRQAADVGEWLLRRFADPATGLVLDVPEPGDSMPQRMRVRLAPLADGGRAASFWYELAAATSDPAWLDPARRALAGWTRAVRGHRSEQAAPFATAAFQCLDAP